MLTLDHIQRACDDAILRAARQSQAAVIAAVDHLARGRDGAPRPLGRLSALQIDLAALAPIDFARAIDEAYGHTQRVLSLHAEFVHRLYEAVDTAGRRAPTLGPPTSSNSPRGSGHASVPGSLRDSCRRRSSTSFRGDGAERPAAAYSAEITIA